MSEPAFLDFAATAQRECAKEIQAVREAFVPSKPIEALLMMAFTRGACWALDIDLKKFVNAPKAEDRS